jgi:hypothetical protein
MKSTTLGVRAASLFVLALAGITSSEAAQAQTNSKSHCFNTDGLSPELRQKSEQYLLEALDSEALFTLVGALKPMSSGFYNARISTSIPAMSQADAQKAVDELGSKRQSKLTEDERARLAEAKSSVARSTTLKEADDLRQIAATWRCGDEVHADIVHFATPHSGNRHIEGVLFSRPALAKMIQQKEKFFSRWSITPHSNPIEVLMAVDYARDASRFAGYGYLFGYPDQAVRFFVDSSVHQDMTGDFVTRDFRAIPTFQRDTGQFTYAVPKGVEETEADQRLKAQASKILAAYKVRREQYVGPGKPGVAALLRDWFCAEEHACSPENATL